jgi:hypothetical protein
MSRNGFKVKLVEILIVLFVNFRLGIEKPSEQYLWPVRKVQEEPEETEVDLVPGKRVRLGETVNWKYFYSNGVEAPAEEDLAELSETVLYERFVIY